MPQRLSIKLAAVVFLAFGFSCFANSARAGFEWVAPAETGPAPSMSNEGAYLSDTASSPLVPVTPAPASSSSARMPAGNMDVISPVIIGASPSTAALPAPTNRNATTAMAPSGGDEVPIYHGPAPEMHPAPPPASMSDASMEPTPLVENAPGVVPQGTTASSEVVRGFANQVPLTVALRQILPPGYAFSIDQNVDMGVLISFKGGRPWRETLRDALVPAGLVMREQGQMVSVGYATSENAATSSGGAMGMPKSKLSKPIETSVAAYQPGTEPQTLEAPGEPIAMGMPAQSPSPSIVMAETWTANRGDSLHKVLEQWSRRAQVEFDWLAEYDYPLQASVSFTGTFESAVRSLLTGFEGAHPQPVAELHSNPKLGQTVLVIQTRGNTDSD